MLTYAESEGSGPQALRAMVHRLQSDKREAEARAEALRKDVERLEQNSNPLNNLREHLERSNPLNSFLGISGPSPAKR
jgi:hypothetical protein